MIILEEEVMKKKVYEKPQLKVVEIQLSECIAGSVNPAVTVKKGSSTERVRVSDTSNSSWDSSF